MSKSITGIFGSIPVIGQPMSKMYLRIRNAVLYDRLREKYSLINPADMPIYVPNSAGSHPLISKLTLQGVNQTIPLLELFSQELIGAKESKIYSIDEFYEEVGNNQNDELCRELEDKFNEYGSDKSTKHNYHLIYATLLKDKDKVKGILEVGMGTNNTNVASNMGANGKPGASLRAFRDFLPHATVYGADFDRGILFEEERIKTFFVDQTRLETFELLEKSIEGKLDLIIDDGLHSPNANLATLIFAMRKMNDNKGGAIVIEDIPPRAIPLWKMVSNIMPSKSYQSYIVKTKHSYMFVCIRK
ncbi:hypothetical protein [Reichenbachiella sp.]|uniref:hypothetical protein n=1 Tax=Reichenbachiella sp. TaxID=2184521 RepID=UPI003B5BC3F4